MRVKCENCNTNFNLDEGLVKKTGSKVRCSKCKHIFMVYPPQPEADESAAEAPVADAGAAAPAGESEPADRQDLAADAPEAGDTSLLDEASPEEAEGESLDLSDIEKMLDAEEKSEAPEEEVEESLSDEDTGSDVDETLDLSDIEKILDEDDSDELIEEKSDEDEDLIFDLDEVVETEVGEEQMSPTTELDLGDLEKMFESEEETESLEGEVFEAPEDEEAPTSFELESEEGEMSEELPMETKEEATAEAPEESDETFGFDVGSAKEDEEREMIADEEGGQALDLEIKDEDITLEEEPELPAADSQELDLEATIAIDSEEITSEEDELDLEATIQIDSETEELDLSLEDVSEISDTEEEAIEAEPTPSDELELELEGDGEEIEAAGGISEEALEIESDEDELPDFGEEMDVDFPDDAVPDIPDEEEAFDEEVPEPEEDKETEEDFEEIEMEEASGGGVKKFLVLLAVLLFIVLLLGAFLFLNYKEIIHVPYLDQIEIPFLSKRKAAQVVDPGNMNISYKVDEDYRFLETDKAGKVFIITGKVTNEYSTSRSFIQVSGSLYTKGKTRADTATAYCGNIISDLELSQMTPAAIRTRLGNRSGDKNSNVNIKPGEERPFMIVFFNLPESLDEFTVAVMGSSEGDA